MSESQLGLPGDGDDGGLGRGEGGQLRKTTRVPVCGPHVGGTRSVCSIRAVAGDGGLKAEVGLGLSIDHSVPDPVRAAPGVKDY